MTDSGSYARLAGLVRMPAVTGGLIAVCVIGVDIYRDTPVPPGSGQLSETFARNDRIYT